MSSHIDELKWANKQRAQMYTFFSRIYFEEVNKESLGQLQQGTSQIYFEDSELANGYEKLKASVEQVASDEDNLDELAADYASLFLGIGRRPAHPYESVYLSNDKIAMREPYQAVSKIYQEEGLSVSDEVKEPEDHVALEFEFMAYMCQRMDAALAKNDTVEAARILEVQRNFSREHLASWIPAFCNDIANGSAKFDFYAAIATLTERLVTLDGEYLATAEI